MAHSADVAIIGGGIVGLATAYKLGALHRDLKLVVLEKEARIASHQTGRNSGVLHTGIYYKPGSEKALNCRRGKRELELFCETEGIPFRRCGKVIVAIGESERPALELIFQRGQANGVECELIGPERLKEIEPHAAGIQAIWVPEAGVVDFKAIAERLAQRISDSGNRVECNAEVLAIRQQSGDAIVETRQAAFEVRHVVNCAGIHADRIAALAGTKIDVQMVPFRGEYYKLNAAADHLVRNLIYPVPDPKLPFLGVHFTRRIDNSVECGPNAVLAWGREAYGKWQMDFRDLFGFVTYPGFFRMASSHAKAGMAELWRSLSKAAFVKALQRLVPEVSAADLIYAPAGIRAQAVLRDGKLVDDFLIVESERITNVCNAPSPAATASLSIGEQIAKRVIGRLA